VGNTSALEQAFRMFGTRGEYFLTEEYAFASALDTAIPLGVSCKGVAVDREGLMPSSLDDIITNWDSAAHNGAPKPWLLYTVPTGQNPTGYTQSIERRREVYAVCQKHDIYILEDEPYYYLQMQPYAHGEPIPPLPKTHAEFLKTLVPSFLSIDIDGRVMRMDSFAKVIAPGSRTGWITASAQIIERFVRHNEVSVQNPAGISQVILWKLLDEHWGHAGYLDWLIALRGSYTERRNALLDACEDFLPKSVCSWVPPAAGMFLWIRVDWRKHRDAEGGKEGGHKTHAEIEDSLFQKSLESGVLLSPGSWFLAEKDRKVDEANQGDMFFRATFAAASVEKMKEAIRRFGEAVKAEFEVTS
jgi:aromatic amino acid aminotransferase I / 2-aminoadipate transaminase